MDATLNATPVFSEEDFMQLDEIEEALAQGRQKGLYEEVIRTAIADGVVLVDFASLPQLKGKDAQVIANSVNNNLKKLRADANFTVPEMVCKISKDKTKVHLINLDVYDQLKAAAAQAAAAGTTTEG